MTCSRCGKNEAAVFYKQLTGNKIREYHLCLDCARAAEGAAVDAASPLYSLLSMMVDQGLHQAPAADPPPCPRCGLRYEEFQQGGLLGCTDCYQTFAPQLSAVLKKYHGSTKHAGRAPARAPQSAEELRRRLAEAVHKEDFEEAARLRDLLRKL
ncbi:MAG: hypothetical protein A2X36_15980 [Elusimicrobia bacterium GWA2_69_24]|nr:MAG: hypothetical protein A2X36_15980 [Elusimicrobia bacterium GWA2_69_24]HBL16603.1 excinuclease ABC subunit B [Elusimicrobiota bacterium]